VGRPSPERTTQRNGYRHRRLDTRVGTIDVAVPKLRTGTDFPEWLLERRKRAESALITVVADCYLAGVPTRRMDKLVKTLGIDSLSKSQVSRMASDLDQLVDEFRHRPLGAAGPFTFVAADALTMKVREGGRVVNAVVLIAVGVNGDGHREVLGMRVATSETGQRGTSSSPTSLPAAWPVSDWSPPMPTPGCERRLLRTCPARPGSGAAPTTPRT
jgi:putative transposase